MDNKHYPIGIDLGTVNSVVAVHRNKKTEIIQCQGSKITPSTVFYHSDENEVSVGNIEELDMRKHTYDVIYDSKRLIGRSFQDQYVQSCRNKFAFAIECTNTNGIHIPVNHNGKQVYKTPQEVSSEILKKLKESAEKYLSYKVKEAVITVPAYFNFSQRNATKQAAKLAGLHVLMLLNEPTAACLHYLTMKNQENTLTMVFDLGGGTLDISIVRMSESGIKVVAVDGDTWLGGRNFDENLLEYIINKHEFILNKRERQRLLKVVEKLKCNLSYKDKASKWISCFIGRTDVTIHLTRTEFETVNLPLFEKCMSIIERSLNKSGIKIENINNIILVGGSIKIPKIKQMVENLFKGKQVSTDLDPDEAVACGAAIQAASMKGLLSAGINIVDVTSFSLGNCLLFDKMVPVIKCNTPLPAENSITTVTTTNYQSSASINVYEGERSRCKLNNFLGKFTINNLPKRPAGKVELIITFKIDESGLLKVTAKEKSTSRTAELEIGVELHDLKSNYMVSLITEIEEDKQFLEFVQKLDSLRDPCVEYICDKNEYEIDVKDCNQFIYNLENFEFEERNKLNDLVKSFQAKLSDRRLRQRILSM